MREEEPMENKIEETVICGGPKDFLEAHHLVLRCSGKEAGRALATIAKDRLGVVKQAWTDPATTRAQRTWIRTHWPAHYERMQGVADAYAIDPNDDRFELSFLFYYWSVPGCSNVFYPPDRTANGHALLSRNYDFSTGTAFELMGQATPPGAPMATARPFLVETRSEHGYACLCTTSYELLGGCVDGVNEHGLAVALLATPEVLRGQGTYRPSRSNGVGLSELHVPRFLLETCTTADEARRVLAEAPQFYITVPCHYLIADRHGDAFVWAHAARPERPIRIDRTPGQPLAITNHLPGHLIADVPPRDESVARLAKLCAAVDAAGPRPDSTTMRHVAEGVAARQAAGHGQYIAQKPARTLWHAFYDLEDLAVSIDFYLADEPDGSIRRSTPRRFALG
jgi:hypothetical protein